MREVNHEKVLERFHISVRDGCWFLAVAGLWTSPARATIFQISLDTSGLSTADTWYLDYQLVASDLPQENSVTLSTFNYGGGSFVGNEVLSGSITGSQLSGYTLTDPANLSIQNVSELLIAFTPGTQVTFDMSYTNIFSGMGAPDAFFWAVEYCDPTTQSCTLPLSSSTTPTTIADPFGPSLGASLISQSGWRSCGMLVPQSVRGASAIQFLSRPRSLLCRKRRSHLRLPSYCCRSWHSRYGIGYCAVKGRHATLGV